VSVVTPITLQRALERGICIYGHLTIQATIPPVEPPGIEVSIAPPKGAYCWHLFALSFGNLSPAGYSADFIIRHRGPGTVLHEDPWVPSIVNYVYPLTETIYPERPHVIAVVNRTGAFQTFDVTLHYMEFAKKEHYDEYRAMVETDERILKVLREILERRVRV